jgi:hypothetical protein
MEDIVDFSRWRELQAECHWGDYLCYFEWPFPSGGQLPRRIAESQVVPFEPYLIPGSP